MVNPETYHYIEITNAQGQALVRPVLPFSLKSDLAVVSVTGLLDTGATVNVLPYEAGLGLGLQWSEQDKPIELTGNLAQYDARGVILQGIVGRFDPVALIFAWTRATDVPLLLGQVNFFAEFDVCFFRARSIFEIQPKA